MFSFSGPSREQVRELCGKHSVYIVNSERISVAGINRKNLDPLGTAIASLLLIERPAGLRDLHLSDRVRWGARSIDNNENQDSPRPSGRGRVMRETRPARATKTGAFS